MVRPHVRSTFGYVIKDTYGVTLQIEKVVQVRSGPLIRESLRIYLWIPFFLWEQGASVRILAYKSPRTKRESFLKKALAMPVSSS